MTSILFAATGILFIGLGIPLWRKRVAPNGTYGFRVKATLENSRLWYKVNSAVGLDMMVLGAALGATSIVTEVVGLPSEEQAAILVGLLTLGSLLMVARGFHLVSLLSSRP